MPALIKGIVFVAGYILWDAFYTIANAPYGSLLNLNKKLSHIRTPKKKK